MGIEHHHLECLGTEKYTIGSYIGALSFPRCEPQDRLTKNINMKDKIK